MGKVKWDRYGLLAVNMYNKYSYKSKQTSVSFLVYFLSLGNFELFNNHHFNVLVVSILEPGYNLL